MKEKETKEQLRARLRRTLVSVGIDPESLDKRQLQSADRLIAACKKRTEDIQEHKEALMRLKPDKTQIAEDAGLSRTGISASHSIILLKIYNFFFPEISAEAVPLSVYKQVMEENARLRRSLNGKEITQARLIVALDDNGALRRKNDLQAQSIINLNKLIKNLELVYLKDTGKSFNVDVKEVLSDPDKWEEEDLKTRIPIPLVNTSGKTS